MFSNIRPFDTLIRVSSPQALDLARALRVVCQFLFRYSQLLPYFVDDLFVDDLFLLLPARTTNKAGLKMWLEIYVKKLLTVRALYSIYSLKML